MLRPLLLVQGRLETLTLLALGWLQMTGTLRTLDRQLQQKLGMLRTLARLL